MIIDCISDLHGHFPKLEGGDLLIIAGDLTSSDDHKHIFQFKNWVCTQKYKKMITLGGNHDNWIQERFLIGPKESWESKVLSYLEDTGTEFEGLKIWGSPWTKTFKGMNPHCKAFTLDSEKELEEKFRLIPDDTDILITHSPPYGMQDIVRRNFGIDGSTMTICEHAGSESLLEKIEVVKPRLHIFGHIHEGYGMHEFEFPFSNGKYVKSVNASHVNERYQPVNKPIRIIL